MSDRWLLKGRIVLEGIIEVVTGLHIGGSQENIDIGGLDSPVVKVEWMPLHLLPATNASKQTGDTSSGQSGADKQNQGGSDDDKSENYMLNVPYIPGSSLRGKMRALLEWANGLVVAGGGGPTGAHECPDPDQALNCPVCRVFGIPAKETRTGQGEQQDWEKLGPTRLRIEDAYPTIETLEGLERFYGDGIYTEVKWENFLNRLTSAANPRQIERVPPGARFKFRMIYDVLGWEGDSQQGEDDEIPTDLGLFKDTVVEAMALLEDSALGGHGSRGYGRIRFCELTLKWRPVEYYKTGEDKRKTYQAKDISGLRTKVRELIEDIGGGRGGG